MRATDVIRARKTDVETSPWTGDAIRAKDFPLSRKTGRRFPLTRRWRWSLTKFTIGPRAFRLLVAYHTQVPEFVAALGEYVAGDCRMICRWEFHQSHAGWHVHANCGSIEATSTGLINTSGIRRIPEVGSRHRHASLTASATMMDDDTAEAIGFSLCGLPITADLFSKNSVPWRW